MNLDNRDTDATTEARPKAEGEAEDRPLRTYRSEELLQGEPQVVILHGGEEYHLRTTRNGKLILYK